jgi:hypothetical protein
MTTPTTPADVERLIAEAEEWEPLPTSIKNALRELASQASALKAEQAATYELPKSHLAMAAKLEADRDAAVALLRQIGWQEAATTQHIESIAWWLHEFDARQAPQP